MLHDSQRVDPRADWHKTLAGGDGDKRQNLVDDANDVHKGKKQRDSGWQSLVAGNVDDILSL